MVPRRLVAPLLLLFVATGAIGRPLPVGLALRRQLVQAQDLNLVLGLDAASASAGSELTALAGGKGDATWPSADPGVTVRLVNAGYDAAFDGSVTFTPPAGTVELGTYGESTELLTVRDGGWGSEFTAVVWYKGAAPAGSNQVLLQVAHTDDAGDLRPSATWRLGGFSDQAQGSRPLAGFKNAAPNWGDLQDCWQQLAVVKSGPQLTFYRNKQAAGTASATFVVNDYGTAAVGVGVEIGALIARTNGTAPAVDPAALAGDLGWLGGSLGSLDIYSRALTEGDIAAAYDEGAARFAEATCEKPGGTTDPAPAPAPEQPASPNQNATEPALPPAPQQPELPTAEPPAPEQPAVPPMPDQSVAPPEQQPEQPTAQPPASPLAQLEPPVQAPPVQPPPVQNNSTFDNSTAKVEGQGTDGRVSNTLALTGGEDLANFESDAVKQQELRRAIVNSLNVDESFTEANVELRVVKVEKQRRVEVVVVEVYEWVVVCEYILIPTPVCPVEVLVKAEINLYLFIRVQQPVMPWWRGEEASVCICDYEGECGANTPPVPPPVKEESCSANVCFLLDGSKSLINVDAWNDVVAATRSIMYSIADPAAMFDVFWFSNDVERIGWQATGAEVAKSNKFIKEIMNTVPNAHGTFMAQAIQTCEDVLLREDAATARTIVLITDGKPTDNVDALEAARAAKAKGLKMVVGGAGDIDYQTLKELASGPSYVFANYELDASGLLKVADLASKGVCRELD